MPERAQAGEAAAVELAGALDAPVFLLGVIAVEHLLAGGDAAFLKPFIAAEVLAGR